MSERRKMLVVGASGLIGYSILKHFASHPDWDVVGISRRSPAEVAGAHHIPLDIRDDGACRRVLSELTDITHMTYAAVYERPGILQGWTGQDRDHDSINLRMLQNVFDPLESSARNLEHISILQGGKAYGLHLGISPLTSLRERQPRVDHRNFYFLQQDYLNKQQNGKSWAWTAWRPMLVFGAALGTALSIVPTIGVYAALMRAQGEPLHYPGNPWWWELKQATDVELLTQAVEWAASNEVARNQVYNIVNGDVFVWEELWPVIADALGMKSGKNRPLRLADKMPDCERDWLDIMERHSLSGPRTFSEMIGEGFAFTDYALHHGKGSGWRKVSILETTKLRQHGFHETIDTEEMIYKWFGRLQESGILPSPE